MDTTLALAVAAAALGPSLAIFTVLRFSPMGRKSAAAQEAQDARDAKALEIEERKVRIAERQMELAGEKVALERDLARDRMDLAKKRANGGGRLHSLADLERGG